MKTPASPSLLKTAACCFGAVLLLGQPARAQAAEATGTILFRIHTFEASTLRTDDSEIALPERRRVLYYRDGGGLNEVELEAGELSSSFRYTGPAPLLLYDQPAAAEGSIEAEPIASMDFDPTWTEILATVRNPLAERFKIAAVPATLASVPEGSVVAFNQSSLPLILNVEGESYPLRPGAFSTFDVAGFNRAPISVKAATEVDGEMRLVYSKNPRFSPRSRIILFFYPNPGRPDKWYSRVLPLPHF